MSCGHVGPRACGVRCWHMLCHLCLLSTFLMFRCLAPSRPNIVVVGLPLDLLRPGQQKHTYTAGTRQQGHARPAPSCRGPGCGGCPSSRDLRHRAVGPGSSGPTRCAMASPARSALEAMLRISIIVFLRHRVACVHACARACIIFSRQRRSKGVQNPRVALTHSQLLRVVARGRCNTSNKQNDMPPLNLPLTFSVRAGCQLRFDEGLRAVRVACSTYSKVAYERLTRAIKSS